MPPISKKTKLETNLETNAQAKANEESWKKVTPARGVKATKSKATPPVETPTPEKPVTHKRSAGIRWRSACGKFFILAITNGGTSEYLVRWLASRGGLRVFTLTKMEIARETTYYTAVPREGDEGHSCGCDGHKGHGHCKHVESLLALRDQGKL